MKESDFLGVKAEFSTRGRKVCVVTDPYSSPGLAAQLPSWGLQSVFKEVWMFTHSCPDQLELPPSVRISECEDLADLPDFLSTFFSAFGGSDPSEPYGALPREYGVAWERAFEVRKHRGLHLYCMRVGEEPIACGMLGVEGKFAGLYGLGVKPQWRGRGFAKLFTQFRLSQARLLGAEHCFLQTETGSVNERRFRSYGFADVVYGEGWSTL